MLLTQMAKCNEYVKYGEPVITQVALVFKYTYYKST